VPGADSYILEWGPTREQPYGGTAKYPGGSIEIHGGTSFTGQVERGDTIFVSLTAVFADGKRSGRSEAIKINILPQPANFVLLRQNGSDITFKWDAVPGASGYMLTCGSSPSYMYEYFVNVGSNTSFHNPQAGSGTWYCIVTSYNEDGMMGEKSQMVVIVVP